MAVTHQKNPKPGSTVFMSLVALLAPVTLTLCGGWGQSANIEATIAAGVAATQQAQINVQATIDAAVAATQTALNQTVIVTPPASTPIPTLLPAVPEPEQVRAVIMGEINAVLAKDLPLLKSLYAPQAVVTDHNGTPDNATDDKTWQNWANIEQRYLALLAAGFSSLNLVDLSIQVDGDRATGTHQGVVVNGTVYRDRGVYTLEKINQQWLIVQVDYGNEPGYNPLASSAGGDVRGRDDGLYKLQVGNQHRYEEPWGWDRGDPCKAWESGNFDDTKPNYRGFNVELLLTNNSETKLPDAWPISFTTARGKSVQACFYGYAGSGPAPGATNSVTFFTVVEKGDYVSKITFSLNDQAIQLCLDGQGGWAYCGN